MLTITYNGKTYSWIGDKWGKEDISNYKISFTEFDGILFSNGKMEIGTSHTPGQLVKLGYMKELEEKDEKPVEKPVEEKKEPTNMDIIKEIVEKDFEKACERFSDPFGTSILYQLRSELERRIKPVAEIQNFCENSIRDELIELLDLLNSLSDKQEKPQILGIDYGAEGGDKGMQVKGYRDDDGTLIITDCDELKKELPAISKTETTEFTPGQEEHKTNMKIGDKTFEITIKSI